MTGLPFIRVARTAARNTFAIRSFLLVSLFIGMALSVSARAATYSFTYTGSGAPFGGSVTDTASGSGGFTVPDTANPAVLSDLSDFTFNLSVTYPAQANAATGTDAFSYGIADLTAFSASFAGDAVTSLSLATVVRSAQRNWSKTFMAGSLDRGGAFTGDGDGDIISSGSVSVTGSSIPEPASLAIVGLGLLALSVRRRAIRRPAG